MHMSLWVHVSRAQPDVEALLFPLKDFLEVQLFREL